MGIWNDFYHGHDTVAFYLFGVWWKCLVFYTVCPNSLDICRNVGPSDHRPLRIRLIFPAIFYIIMLCVNICQRFMTIFILNSAISFVLRSPFIYRKTHAQPNLLNIRSVVLAWSRLFFFSVLLYRAIANLQKKKSYYPDTVYYSLCLSMVSFDCLVVFSVNNWRLRVRLEKMSIQTAPPDDCTWELHVFYYSNV